MTLWVMQAPQTQADSSLQLAVFLALCSLSVGAINGLSWSDEE